MADDFSFFWKHFFAPALTHEEASRAEQTEPRVLCSTLYSISWALTVDISRRKNNFAFSRFFFTIGFYVMHLFSQNIKQAEQKVIKLKYFVGKQGA